MGQGAAGQPQCKGKTVVKKKVFCSSHNTHIGFHLSKHAVPVIPDTVKTQHLSIHDQKLSQLIKIRWCVVAPRRLLAGFVVWVLGTLLSWVEVDTFTSHEFLVAK